MKKFFVTYGLMTATIVAALLAISVKAFAESDATADPQTGTKTANSATEPASPAVKQSTVKKRTGRKHKRSPKTSAESAPAATPN